VKYGHRIEIINAINKLNSRIAHEELGQEEVPNRTNAFQHAQEVRKWVNPGADCGILWNNTAPVVRVANACPTKGEQDTEVGRNKSKRARPGNHIAYKALHTVTIKGGKSFSSPLIGQLLENSVVLINQTKGRRGRIVLRKSNGEFANVGWVPLFTNEGQQLLRYWRKGNMVVKNSDAIIKWETRSPLEEEEEKLPQEEQNTEMSEVTDSIDSETQDETFANKRDSDTNLIIEDSDTNVENDVSTR